MDGEFRKKAAEAVLKECLENLNVREALEAAKEAGREIAETEARQVFENALAQNKFGEAVAAARLMTLSESDKQRLLTACFASGHIIDALELTEVPLSEKDFHRLVKRAINNWEWQEFVITLTKKTGYRLTDSEKKDFIELMVKKQRKNGFDSSRLQSGLDFLGEWLPSHGAQRLFAVLEGNKSAAEYGFDQMMHLAVLAEGRVVKESILKMAASVIGATHLDKIEESVRKATGEDLTSDDRRYLLRAALDKDDHRGLAAALVIAAKYPDDVKEYEYSQIIQKSIYYCLWSETVAVAGTAAKAGKLSRESLKSLVLKVRQGHFQVKEQIDVYELVLGQGLNLAEMPVAESKN